MSSDNAQIGAEVTPIFGLTKAELWPIVEEAADEAVASFDISLEHVAPEPYGAAGEKEIPTFGYVTKTGRTGRVTVFVKRYNNAGPAEARQYRFLLAHQAPIPRLYGVLVDPEGREMLFIEYLDSSRAARSSAYRGDGLLGLLALMARFQAVVPSEEFTVWLRRDASGLCDRLAGAEPALEQIWEHSAKGEMGQDLQGFCSSSGRAFIQIRTLVRQVIERSSEMPQALLHSDFSVENTGLRESGERLVMDVGSICLGPRFFDVAGILGIPSERWYRDLSRKELARHYLGEYARWGGTPPPIDAFLRDMGILWLAGDLRYLGLNLERAFGRNWGTTPATEDDYRACRIHLYRTLHLLLAQYLMRGTRCSVLDRR